MKQIIEGDIQLKEVAKMLGVKNTTAHMIQKRAIQKFKKELLRRGYKLTDFFK